VPLTDVAVRKAIPRDKPFKLFDGGGLHLMVMPGGGKLWRMRYALAGKEKLLSFGPYPEVGLAAARAAREDARQTLRAGRDPSLDRRMRRAQAANTERFFEAVARAWHSRQTPRWTARHASDVLDSLEAHVFPKLGTLPVGEITPPMVLTVIQAIERRPAVETARRVRQRVSAVFVYAIASGLAVDDPASKIAAALAPQVKGRQPAITDLEKLRAMLRDVEAAPAHPTTRLAMRFLALTAVRPGEVRGMLRHEAEGDLWRVPAERMKMRREHWVPLSKQAQEALAAASPLAGKGGIAFPSSRWAHRPLSENALGYALNRAGYHGHHVPHGFRAAFSTIMNERFPPDRAVIDLMLAHVPGNSTEAAYNRALHLDRRRELAQIWADLLLDGFPPADDLLDLARR